MRELGKLRPQYEGVLVEDDCGMAFPCTGLLSMGYSALTRLATPVLAVDNCGMAEEECETLTQLR